MLRRLYDWVMGLAASKHAPKSLFAVSFAESSFFPIPPDVMLAPMVLARPDKAWTYAAICTADTSPLASASPAPVRANASALPN